MDQLFKRYADPFSFMDGMIQAGRFFDFVVYLVKMINQEKEEKMDWELWLHKVWDKSFDEFKTEIETDTANRNMSAETIETTVQESLDILKNFTPQQGGE